uniref:Secreted protein n=1 Tax=Knipowitschia caucasica TaxID=637954 RepID=A0AAV2K250_KNICA
MRLLFVAFLLASLRLLSTPAPSMALRYTSSQLIRLNHRAPPSLDITSTLQQHCLVRRRPYIHRGPVAILSSISQAKAIFPLSGPPADPCAAHTGLVPTTSAYVIRALIT